jgi:hypothetical protein
MSSVYGCTQRYTGECVILYGSFKGGLKVQELHPSFFYKHVVGDITLCHAPPSVTTKGENTENQGQQFAQQYGQYPSTMLVNPKNVAIVTPKNNQKHRKANEKYHSSKEV